MFWAGMPRPTDSAPWGSRSISRTRRPYSVSAAPRLMVDVVLPTPPFWLHIAMTRAGPCSVRGLGSGSGRCRAFAGSCCREAAPISGPLSCGRATAEAASARVAMGLCASTSCPIRVHRVRSAVLPARVRRKLRTVVALPKEARRDKSTWRRMTTEVTAQAEKGRTVAKAFSAPMSVTGARMAARVDLAQPVDGHERVDLRRGHRRVAQQLLDHADV